MKYKVMLFRNETGTADDYPQGSFSFYTYNAAHEACNSWNAIGATFQAWMYDGTTWRQYV